MTLTPERIRELWESYNPMQGIESFARAIETEALQAQAQEIEGLRKDAERWRWLRAEHERVDPVCHLTWKRGMQRDSAEWVNTARLDTAIDAAMAQKGGSDEVA